MTLFVTSARLLPQKFYVFLLLVNSVCGIIIIIKVVSDIAMQNSVLRENFSSKIRFLRVKLFQITKQLSAHTEPLFICNILAEGNELSQLSAFNLASSATTNA